jgi:hypothetical protein
MSKKYKKRVDVFVIESHLRNILIVENLRWIQRKFLLIAYMIIIMILHLYIHADWIMIQARKLNVTYEENSRNFNFQSPLDRSSFESAISPP